MVNQIDYDCGVLRGREIGVGYDSSKIKFWLEGRGRNKISLQHFDNVEAAICAGLRRI